MKAKSPKPASAKSKPKSSFGPIRLGIIAPASVIPKVEFEIGVQCLERNGFEVNVHPQVYDQHMFYAGSDDIRAQSLLDFAYDHETQAVWCARGGYGATHLLPYLEKASRKKKPKKKTLLGYSDATALMEFVRTQWGWNTIHAPMPSLRTFSILKPAEWSLLVDSIHNAVSNTRLQPSRFDLTEVYAPKGFKKLDAAVVGGNLAVWNSMIGTPYAGNAKGKILFFEDIHENVARINRMLHQLEQSGGLKGAKGIILGDFTECNDTVPQCLQVRLPQTSEYEELLRHPPAEMMGYLRSIYPPWEALDWVFGSVGERLKIPVFKGLPVGHGSNHFSLVLGKKHSLKANGSFQQIA
jgi:muramoyltetrapeptide carboxypeptidase